MWEHYLSHNMFDILSTIQFSARDVVRSWYCRVNIPTFLFLRDRLVKGSIICSGTIVNFCISSSLATVYACFPPSCVSILDECRATGALEISHFVVLCHHLGLLSKWNSSNENNEDLCGSTRLYECENFPLVLQTYFLIETCVTAACLQKNWKNYLKFKVVF